jgi:hypothetical protein
MVEHAHHTRRGLLIFYGKAEPFKDRHGRA